MADNEIGCETMTTTSIISGLTESVIYGTPGDDTIYGADGNDSLSGRDGADVLDGGNGNDSLDGGSGSDTLVGGAGDDLILSWEAGDSIIGGSGNDTFGVPFSYDDWIYLGASNTLTVIEGGDGVDTLYFQGDLEALNYSGIEILTIDLPYSSVQGRASQFEGFQSIVASGAEIFLVDAGAVDFSAKLTDRAKIYASNHGNNITGSAFSDELYGGNSADTLNGGGGDDLIESFHGNDYLDGGAGFDTMMGGLGDDTFVVESAIDVASEEPGEGTDTVLSARTYALTANVEILVLTGTGANTGTGNALNNSLTGNDAVNWLDGAAGNDTLAGGLSNDTYVVDAAGDVTSEAEGAGTDTVRSSVSWTLGANTEILLLTGTQATNGTGNALNNILTGNSAVNVLSGGLGNDTYNVQNTTDMLAEGAGEGTDAVLSNVTFTLGANVENLTLIGNNHVNATGNEFGNVLIGNVGNNILTGGLGDDTYYIQNVNDFVVEQHWQGTDTVYTTVAYSLFGRAIENLFLRGTDNLNATGNSLANALTGNTGNNVLSGAGGNDTYYVQNAGDSVIENANEGIDTVVSTVAWTLGDNVENATLTGNQHVNLTGNALNNVLTGNIANNTLTGGLGDDTYYIQNVADNVAEQHFQGTDVIYSTVTYSLFGRAVENLILQGTENLNATGNSLNNILTGNSGANRLEAGVGNDTFSGGLGADVFVFLAASGKDTITDFSGSQNDTININAYTAGTANAAMVTQAGANVLINLGGGNTVTVLNAGQADVLAHTVW